MRPGICALIFFAAAVSGCGGSDDADQFVGTWRIDQATGSIDCGGTGASSISGFGNVEMQRGVSAALVSVAVFELDAFTFCDFSYDVNGTTATIHGTQSCTLLGQQNAVFTPGTWRFALTSATTAEETGDAKIVFPADPANMIPATVCQYTAHMAALTKVGK
jgi:hypothetical protein